MEYRCRMISASSLTISGGGIVMPLCMTCGTKDCSNPIEKMRVSIFGVTKEIRMYNRGADPKMVIECEGYTNI